MSLANKVEGMVRNWLLEEDTVGVVCEAVHIAGPDRFDWKQAEPLPGEERSDFSRWVQCWRRMTVSDLDGFPVWEKEVYDVLHE